MIYYRIEKKEDGIRLYEPERNPDYNRKTESVFAQCNGYLGIRASYETKQLEESRGTFLGGFYHRAGSHEVAELVNCPDVTEFRIRINGTKLYLDTCTLKACERSLNTRYGVLESRVKACVGAGGNQGTAGVVSRRFASMDDKRLFCHEISITCENGGTLELSTGINGQITNSGVSHFDRTAVQVFGQRRMAMECGCDDGQVLYVTSQCSPDGPARKPVFHLERRSIWQDFIIKLEPGETWSLCKYTLFERAGGSGAGREETAAGFPDSRTGKVLNHAARAGFGGLYRVHREAFDRFWDMAAIRIEGALPEEQAAIEFAQYHLAGMVPWEDGGYSAGAKGLTGEGYKGHVFWDTELFIMPFFTMMFPQVSRNLLLYRYRGLPGARKKAEEYGYSGAMYPWESASDGTEETPLYAAMDIHTGKAAKVWSGIKEHHVTADIIHGLLDYYHMTGDDRFMEQYGCEMVLETAVFWCSRAAWNEEKKMLEIKDVIGPDEYTEHVDNNAYTNYMAYENVKAAAGILDSWEHGLADAYRSKGWDSKFRFFLEHIYLPKPNAEGIIPQDDTFLGKRELPDIGRYRDADARQLILKDYSRSRVVDMQVLKQADVVMLLELLPERFDAETVKRNIAFYETRTIHDSSLSLCAHGEAEAIAGNMDMAEVFWKKALEIDLGQGYKDSGTGIHAASLGGILNCVLRGFAGIRTVHDPDSRGKARMPGNGIYAVPHLPEHWKSMQFSVMDHGKRKQVTVAKQGAGTAMGGLE